MSDESESGQKVLAIDDDEDIRVFMKRFLKASGFTPLLADRGEEGLRLLAEHTDVAVILLDWMMPGMSGIDVLKELGKIPDAPPTLMLTARSATDDAEEAIHAGAVDYLTKPIGRDNLLFKLNNILARDRDRARNTAARRKPINSQARVSFRVLELTESSCRLESTFPIEPGAVLFLQSPELSHRLDVARETRLSFRVTASEGEGNRYRLSGELVGLSPQLTARLREAKRQGELLG